MYFSLSASGQSITLQPTIQASKLEVIEEWEGFDVVCEVNIPLGTTVDLAWDYPGQMVKYASATLPPVIK